MKKILDLLEQKVQWIVLALGVAYVAYMAFSYLVSPPVRVNVAGAEVMPSEVDAKVLTIAEQLDSRINSTQLPAELPQPQQYVADFKSELDYGGKLADSNANALVYHVWGSVKLPDMPNLPSIIGPGSTSPDVQPGTPIVSGSTPAPNAPLSGPVEALPKLVAPTITHSLTGLSNVNPTPNPNAQGGEVAGVDKSWVTVRFELELDSLAKQWDGLKLPPSAVTTSFLNATLTRQEQQSDGSWGKDTVIGPLPFHNVPPFPPQAPPNTAHYEFIKWATTHTQEVMQPAFFPVIKGDPWFIPGEQAPVPAAIAAFKPEQWIDKTPQEIEKAGLTTEQKRLISAAKEKRRQEENRGRGRGGGARPAPAPRGGANPVDALNVLDPDRPVSYQPIDNVDNPVDAPVDAPGPGVGAQPIPVRANAAAGAGQGKFQIPLGDFDPRTWSRDHVGKPVIGWVHDATATPGATYRYKVSYAMKNPVFGNKLAVKRAELMEPMSIRSLDSAWSNPIDVASPVSFFVSGTPREANGTVPIDVFRLQGGEPHRKSLQVSLGDPIGGMDGTIDYSTGWTLIDVAKDPRQGSPEWHIILMDSKGTVRRRLMTEDQKDPRFQRLKDQANAPAAAAAAR